LVIKRENGDKGAGEPDKFGRQPAGKGGGNKAKSGLAAVYWQHVYCLVSRTGGALAEPLRSLPCLARPALVRGLHRTFCAAQATLQALRAGGRRCHTALPGLPDSD
jgi:hypothetical protein